MKTDSPQMHGGLDAKAAVGVDAVPRSSDSTDCATSVVPMATQEAQRSIPGDDECDRALVEAAVGREAGALGSDMHRYLGYARIIEALGYVGAYLVLPALVYLLFVRQHSTLAWLAAVGALIVVAIHAVGAPYRWQDRRRARSLLQRSSDLSAVLERRPVPMPELKAALDRACAAGMVLDDRVFDLVQVMAAGDASANAADRSGTGTVVHCPC